MDVGAVDDGDILRTGPDAAAVDCCSFIIALFITIFALMETRGIAEYFLYSYCWSLVLVSVRAEESRNRRATGFVASSVMAM